MANCPQNNCQCRQGSNPLAICIQLIEHLKIMRGDGSMCPIANLLFTLGSDEHGYWISTLYTRLIGEKKRKELAAYFTPPNIAGFAINQLVSYGLNLNDARILDPASGGSAFISPLARACVQASMQKGLSLYSSIQSLGERLHGIEIDSGLAILSQCLVEYELKKELQQAGCPLPNLVEHKDALCCGAPDNLYDVVIGNPPFGRVRSPGADLLNRFDDIISEQYVNRYVLFLKLVSCQHSSVG